MGKTKIEWADYTWNPLTGCHNNCEYCYAKRMSKRFSGNIGLNLSDETQYKKENGVYILEHPFTDKGRVLSFPFGFNPTFHKYRLKDPEKWKSGQNIFVGSMTDLFSDLVPYYILRQIFDVVTDNEQHNYLFLTKNPDRYNQLLFSDCLPMNRNIWYGCTADNREFKSISSLNGNTFVSFEPVLEEIISKADIENALKGITVYKALETKPFEWAIIGAETGNRADKVTPKKEWIDNIVYFCDIHNIPVFMKDSLIDIVGEENMRRELPEGLKRHEMSEKSLTRL